MASDDCAQCVKLRQQVRELQDRIELCRKVTKRAAQKLHMTNHTRGTSACSCGNCVLITDLETA